MAVQTVYTHEEPLTNETIKNRQGFSNSPVEKLALVELWL